LCFTLVDKLCVHTFIVRLSASAKCEDIAYWLDTLIKDRGQDEIIKTMLVKNYFLSIMLKLILININSFSQGRNDTVAYISKYPVKKGYIYLFKEKIGSVVDPANTLCIFSKDSNVFAVKEGRVKRIFRTDGYG
jgi:hypothetical protein